MISQMTTVALCCVHNRDSISDRDLKLVPPGNLTDEQLVDLFSEMKRETVAKREKEMERFKVEKPDNKDDALLDDFNDELEAMRGEDSDNEEVTGLI